MRNNNREQQVSAIALKNKIKNLQYLRRFYKIEISELYSVDALVLSNLCTRSILKRFIK